MKQVLISDIEADGLLEDVSQIHCIVNIDNRTGKVYVFSDYDYLPKWDEAYLPEGEENHLEKVQRDGTIADGVAQLENAKLVAGHNYQGYDAPALKKLANFDDSKTRVLDSMILAMMAFGDAKSLDFKLNAAAKRRGVEPPIRGPLIGRHHLEAWGARLNEPKMDFKPKSWKVASIQMIKYCVQDVKTNRKLVNMLFKQPLPADAVEMEHKFAKIMDLQQLHGFPFDDKRAKEFASELEQRKEELNKQLQVLFPPKTVISYTKVKRIKREKIVPFNPASRMQIGQRLVEKYKWKPAKYNSQGPVINDDILKGLATRFPEAKILAEYFRINKIHGYVRKGSNAWLKLVGLDGRMHGRVKTLGTVSSRCSHSSPNMGQIPSVKKKWGRECRELFVAMPGYKVVGCDASGIQLRALAHYLAPFDGGEYARRCLSGDQHNYTQEVTQVETRDLAKTLMYGVLFGASPGKVGTMCGKTSSWGKATITKLMAGLIGLKQLKFEVELEAKSGFIKALDGRRIPVRSPHSALNFLLQSFEAIVMKRATVLLHERLQKKGWVFGVDYWNAAHVHDEYQFIVKEELATELGVEARQAIIDAGIYYKSRCDLDGEFKAGNNWSETH